MHFLFRRFRKASNRVGNTLNRRIMKTIEFNQLETINGGDFWVVAGCISGILAWCGSYAAATLLTGGVGAIALWGLGHTAAGIGMSFACADWIGSTLG